MSNEDRISYHSNRAMTELDMALRASSIQAARSHFSLSSLHLEQFHGLKVQAVATQMIA